MTIRDFLRGGYRRLSGPVRITHRSRPLFLVIPTFSAVYERIEAILTDAEAE